MNKKQSILDNIVFEKQENKTIYNDVNKEIKENKHHINRTLFFDNEFENISVSFDNDILDFNDLRPIKRELFFPSDEEQKNYENSFLDDILKDIIDKKNKNLEENFENTRLFLDDIFEEEDELLLNRQFLINEEKQNIEELLLNKQDIREKEQKERLKREKLLMKDWNYVENQYKQRIDNLQTELLNSELERTNYQKKYIKESIKFYRLLGALFLVVVLFYIFISSVILSHSKSFEQIIEENEKLEHEKNYYRDLYSNTNDKNVKYFKRIIKLEKEVEEQYIFCP